MKRALDTEGVTNGIGLQDHEARNQLLSLYNKLFFETSKAKIKGMLKYIETLLESLSESQKILIFIHH